jgi:hypothetical protein
MSAPGLVTRSPVRRFSYRAQLSLVITEEGGMGGSIRDVRVDLLFRDPQESAEFILDSDEIVAQGGSLRFAARANLALPLHVDFNLGEPPSRARLSSVGVRVDYTDDGGRESWLSRVWDANHPTPPGWPFDFDL